MFRFAIYCGIVLTSFNIQAQEIKEIKETKNFTSSDDVKIENAPNFYSIYFSEMRLNDNWSLRIEKHEQTLGFDTNRLYEFPFLAKYNLTKTLRLFAGPQFDFEMDFNGGLINSSLRGVIGIEKEVTPNFLLHAAFNYRIINVKSSILEVPVFNNISGFNLGSRFKF